MMVEIVGSEDTMKQVEERWLFPLQTMIVAVFHIDWINVIMTVGGNDLIQ